MLFATGVVFPKVIWDPTAGALEAFGPRGLDHMTAPARNQALTKWRQQIEDRVGHPLTGAELRSLETDGRIWLPQGEPRVEWRTGVDLTEPPLCRRIGGAPWLIESVWVSLDDLAEEFGSKAVGEVEASGDGAAYQTAWRNLYSDEATAQAPEGCLRHQLWIPHSLNHPGGFWAVVAGGAVLRRGPHPYKHGGLPFAELRELPEPRFRPTCTVANMLGLQDARNKLASGANWYAHRRLRAPVLVEDDSGLPDDAFEGRVPAKLPCRPGANLGRKASHFQFAPLPPEILNLDALMRMDLTDVAGVHDATTGRRESAQESGRHAALLQAADLARNTPTRQLLDNGMSAVGALILWLWWEYATSERALTITGDDAEADTLRFMGKSLANKHQRPEWRVRVELGDEQDLGDQVAQVEALTRMGYMSPERAADRLLVRSLLRGHIADVGEEERRQRRRVASEHRALLAGRFGEVRVVEGDDDELHIGLHRRWTLSDEYRDTFAKGAQVKEALELHIRSHEFDQAIKLTRFKVLAESQAEVLKAHYQAETARRLSRMKAGEGRPAASATSAGGPAGPAARRPLLGRLPLVNRFTRRR